MEGLEDAFHLGFEVDIGRIFVSLGELPKPPPIDLCAIYMSVVL